MSQRAIVRTPCLSFEKGITTTGQTPDYITALQQHLEYIGMLEKAGFEVIVLDPLPDFPDSCFVEDTAIITPEASIITRPGAIERQGEVKYMADVLNDLSQCYFIELPAKLDGGDVLRVEKKIFVGLSDRTNQEGADQLQSLLSPFGYKVFAIPVGDLLHLKTGVNYIGRNTLIASSQFKSVEAFSEMNMLLVDDDEAYAANCLLLPDGTILMPSGYPKTKKLLQENGFFTWETDVSEFRKMDGGLTCLSLLMKNN